MECKNCKTTLLVTDDYCSTCGAKVVKERITVKSLFSHLLDALGWDSNFFVTLRLLLYKPQTVLKEYIGGTRKKYANPFTFFTIILAFSLFIFSQFSEEFIQMSIENYQQTQVTENTANTNEFYNLFGFNSQNEFSRTIMEGQMKYYNLVSFLFLPLYTLIAFIVFRKPYNFGEHLVINTYLLGISTFISVVLFIFSLITNINVLDYALLLQFLYYSFAYQRLYRLTFVELLLKTLIFFGILLLLFLIPVILGFVMMVMKSK